MGPARLKGRPSPVRSWIFAGLAVGHAGVILATLGIAPKLWFQLLPYLRPHVTRWYLAVGGVAAGLLMLWSQRSRVRQGVSLLALLGVLSLYAALLFGYYGREAPAKKFHLLEYGVLAGLTFQAVRIEEDDRRGLLLGCLFLFAVGTADETLQGRIPMRTFRWLDMFGNYVASALGGLAWAAASPRSPWRRQPPEPHERHEPREP